MKFKITYIISLTLFLSLSSCVPIDRNDKVPASNLPEQTIVRDEAVRYHLPNTTEGYRLASAIKNPMAETQENINKGKIIYEQYCIHCHGKSGKADAPMIEKEKYPPPPPFQKRLPTITEGQMFHSVYYGKNQMPDNQNDLTTEQIWLIITYIKTLVHPVNDSLK